MLCALIPHHIVRNPRTQRNVKSKGLELDVIKQFRPLYILDEGAIVEDTPFQIEFPMSLLYQQTSCRAYTVSIERLQKVKTFKSRLNDN